MMLDKNAFEKALNQDKAQVSSQVPSEPKNNLKFSVQENPVVQTSGKTKREQLWEQRKMQKASKISPAFAAPGPVIKSTPETKSTPGLNFPGQSGSAPSKFTKPQEIKPQNNQSNFQVIGKVEETPLTLIEPKGHDFGAATKHNAPVSVPSGFPAKNEIVATKEPPQPINFNKRPPSVENFNTESFPAAESFYGKSEKFNKEPAPVQNHNQPQPPPPSYEEPRPLVPSRGGTREEKINKSEYLNDWKKEMEERELRKKREKEEERRKEREEMEKYSDPFGKAGAGAPNKNNRGQVITNRREAVEERIHHPPAPSYNDQKVSYNAPQMSQPEPPPQVYHPPQQPQPQVYQPPKPKPTVSFQPPIQQMMPEPSMGQNFQNPYMGGGSINNFQGGNPYDFQQPMLPQQNMGFNNPMPSYQQRQPSPPQMNNNMGGFGMNPGNNFGMGFHNQPMGGGGNMPDPNGMLPQPQGFNNISMDVYPTQEPVMAPSNKRTIQTPAGRDEGTALDVGGNEDLLANNKNKLKNEWQQQLIDQMEEKKRKKEEEKRRLELEDLEEEKKLQREREEMERQYKMEQDKEKQKFKNMQKENEALIEAKKKKQEDVRNNAPKINSRPPNPNRRQEVFGNGGQEGPTLVPVKPIQPNFEAPQQPPQVLGKTKIFSEIQEQIKKNFDEELDKLRLEMNSRNKQMRAQMEMLKGETDKAVRERNEANKELQRMKELLDKKKAQDGYQNKLVSALNRYAPKGTNEDAPERRAASRGGVDMNNYEQMFFNKNNNNINLAGKSLRGDSALVPVDHNDTISNYFHKGTIKKQEQTFKQDKKGIPIYEKSPEAVKTHAIEVNEKNPYTGNIEIPTLDSGIKNQIYRNRVKYQFEPDTEEKSTIKADDTLDFINKINGIGGDPNSNDEMKFGRQDSLSKKVNEIRKNKLNDTGFTANSNNMALDIDNFPALPEYEGIQSKFLESAGRGKLNDTSFHNKGDDSLNNSVLKNDSPAKSTRNGGMGVRDSTQSFGNGTVTTLRTVNTINLEKINNRNDNRLLDFENKYNFRDGGDDTLSNLLKNHDNDMSYEAIKLDNDTEFKSNNDYLRSIKEEKWEGTLKKHL
ncbi:unnamed protein product [Moneuplotes crassus]|uniref:Uncharacterized protein n=1 Tax=Euplotes crassus TaxID=5936 RepID=A0AAD1XPF2_EUPCR|nr:unnamed protein product [Moneuplotes crassus]